MLSAGALLLGIFVATVFGNPFLERTRTWTPRLLSLSVMGLGAGMNLRVVAEVGRRGLGYTFFGILSAFLVGLFLRRALKTSKAVSQLITVGTAICGGSAIAAISPVIRAPAREVTVALGTVFLLNACALVIFPFIGHALSLSEAQFGLWSALAIHDTSSVVGTTLGYGPHALEVGTTVKLARALWILPLTLVFATIPRHEATELPAQKRRYPWFIVGFILVAALVTYVPSLGEAGRIVEAMAKKILVLTLFLIGANLSLAQLRTVGLRPLAFGFLLWAWTAGVSLFAIRAGWIYL